MAPFAFDPLDEEQKKQQQAQNAGQGAPAMTGGGDSFGEGASQQPNQQKGVAKQGSGFVGLDKYMNANQGNNFGGQLTGKVQDAVSTAKQGFEKGVNDFTQASNQGATKWNDVGDQVKGIVDNAGDNTTKDDVTKLQGYAGAKYQGPDNFYGSAYGAQAQGGVEKATQQAKALQSEGGRFALLDQYFGRPSYNMGEKSLDNLLVQNAPGTGARAQSIGGQAKQLASNVGQETQGLDNLAASNKQATIDAAKQTRDYLGNAVTGFQSDLDKRYADYNSANDAYNKARADDVGDDALDADTMGAYGLDEGANLYDTNLSNYIQENPKASEGQFASDKDYARYLALSQLSGDDPTALTAANRAQAGQGDKMGRVSVDKDRLNQDLSSKKASYDTQAQQLQQGISQSVGEVGQRQAAYDAYYNSLPDAQSVTGGGGKQEDDKLRILRDMLNQAKSKMTSYQSQYQALNDAMKPGRKVSKA